MASPRPSTTLTAAITILLVTAILCDPAEARHHHGSHHHGGHHRPGQGHHRHGHGGNHHGHGTIGQVGSLRRFCTGTDYPALCYKVGYGLKVKGPMTDMVLAEAVTQAAIKTTMTTRSVAGIVSLSPRLSKMGRESLKVCLANYDDVINNLETGLAALQSRDFYTALIDFSAAVTDVETCKDAFAERPGLVSPIANRNTNFMCFQAQNETQCCKIVMP